MAEITTPSNARPKARRWILMTLLVLLGLPMLGFAAWTWISLNMSYANVWGTEPGMLIMDNSPSHVLQAQPFLEIF